MDRVEQQNPRHLSEAEKRALLRNEMQQYPERFCQKTKKRKTLCQCEECSKVREYDTRD